MPRVQLASALVVLLLPLASCTPKLEDDTYACPDGACPDGFRCVGGFCRNMLAGDCIVDAHCDDHSACTTETCVDGFCRYAAVADEEPCDDELFCNGRETCVGGACQDGSIPCPGCVENPDVGMPRCGGGGCGAISAMCCPGLYCEPGAHCYDGLTCSPCGTFGLACCDGSFCIDGSGCNGGTCGGCGRLTESCCTDLIACTEGACGPEGMCVECGGEGQPCCADGCDGSAVCDYSTGFSTCTTYTCATGGCSFDQVCAVDLTVFPTEPPSCIECGQFGAPCCADRRCYDETLTCDVGTCYPPATMPGTPPMM